MGSPLILPEAYGVPSMLRLRCGFWKRFINHIPAAPVFPSPAAVGWKKARESLARFVLRGDKSASLIFSGRFRTSSPKGWQGEGLS
jgi:hypothetical protein